MSALAGAIGERVTLVLRDGHRDALGGADGAWRDGATVWAAVVPADGADRFAVTVRSGVDLTGVERMRWRGRVLRVVRVEADPRAKDRVTLATETVR